MAVRKRTRAREIALQQLYAEDVRADGDEIDVDEFLRQQTSDDEIYLFALGLVHGTNRHVIAIDTEIRRCAQNWHLARLAAVDRNILRLGVYELRHRPDVPPQVTLNEAIELAKRFSTAKSGGFVNGVLDRIRQEASVEVDAVGPLPDGAAPEPAGETTEPVAWTADDEDEGDDAEND